MEKKKIRFNWIDLAIIAVIIVFIVFFINREKIKKSIGQENTRSIIITTQAEGLTDDALDKLKKGDKIFNEDTFQDAEIYDIETFPTKEYLVNSKGVIEAVDKDDDITAVVKIKANANYTGPYISLGGQEIKAGIDMYVKTEKVAYLARIKNVEVYNENNR